MGMSRTGSRKCTPTSQRHMKRARTLDLIPELSPEPEPYKDVDVAADKKNWVKADECMRMDLIAYMRVYQDGRTFVA